MTPAVSVRDLNVRINGNAVLEGITFDLPQGAYLSVVGPNGSGKTTLLKSLLGINKDYSGEIKMFGANPDSAGVISPAYVPQIKTLDRSFPALSIELVLSGFKRRWLGGIKKDDEASALEMLNKVSARHLAYTPLNKLSGGELQRIYLARCLITNPGILLLDEPATGIDLVCEHSINKIINQYNKEYNTTVIMVTHDWSAAYHHTNYTLLINKNQVFFGNSKDAFSDYNLQQTFSHIGHDHGISFGLKGLHNG